MMDGRWALRTVVVLVWLTGKYVRLLDRPRKLVHQAVDYGANLKHPRMMTRRQTHLTQQNACPTQLTFYIYDYSSKRKTKRGCEDHTIQYIELEVAGKIDFCVFYIHTVYSYC
jgi:hypothetical protein